MADTATTHKSDQTLESKLEEMLEIEKFDPPEEFAKHALLERSVGLRRGREGLEGLVDEAGEGAPLVQGAHRGRRRVQPAVLQVVRGRQDQRLLQLPGPPRRGRERRSGRVPLARRGRRGGGHHLRRPAPRRAEVRQRAEGPRHREGRHRRHLPADDPRGRRRDAGVRPHRRAAQRRVRRLLGRLGPRADGVLRGQGADHRRRRPAQGQDREHQAGGRRGDGRPRRRSSTSSWSSEPTPTAR